MNTVSSPVKETEEEKKGRNWLPLLLLLLFLLLATSCIAGFLLGRTSDPGRLGALIDTIVLTPPTPSQPVPSTPIPPATPAVSGTPGPELGRLINLLGAVRYTDGRPFTQGAVRLQSDPRYSALDEKGRFNFDGVATGKHRLTVLDPDGNELAGRDIDVARDAVENSYIEQTATLCIMHIKVLTVEVDIDVTLDETPGSELDIRLTGTREEEEPPAVTPSTTPGTPPSARPSTPPSAEPSVTPSAEPSATPTAGPSAPPTAEPSATPTAEPSATPTAGPSATPTAEPSATPTATPSASPSATPSVEPTSTPTATPTVTPSSEPTAAPTPTPTPRPTVRPTPTPKPTDSGTTDVYDNESGKTWTQQAVIDLFRSQDGSHPPIAPGSKGYYVFRLRNGRSEPISFTMSLLEESFHIPLEYRIATDELIPRGLTGWQTASLGAPAVSDKVPMAARGEQRFRIEWRWPPDGNDAEDTALGQRDDRTYTLKLTIKVEGTV